MMRRRKAQLEHEDADLSERLIADDGASDSPREHPSSVIVHPGPFSLPSFLSGWRQGASPGAD
jgi:hypothetical protein